MLRAVALVPSPPLLVPELTGRGAHETTAVRDAAVAAAAALGAASNRWLAVGVAATGGIVPSATSGTFADFGVDVPVALSPTSSRPRDHFPLAAAIAGWLRGTAAPEATVDVHLVGDDVPAADCRRLGHDLRRAMDAAQEPWGLLVVADGASTLTPKAPGAFDARAEAAQNGIDDALATGDIDALAAIDRALCDDVGVGGFAAWQALVGIAGEDRFDARTLYRDAPFGVGYFVGTWTPAR